MEGFSVHIFLFIIPAIIANIAHMVVVKKNYFSFLVIPISKEAFGQNKTHRGLIFLPIAMAFIIAIESLIIGPFTRDLSKDLFIGFGLGFSYILFELPNSFVKRRMGISSGASSGRYRLLQTMIDKTDSILGMCLFYYLFTEIDIRQLTFLIVISLLIHFTFSYILVLIKLKKSI